LAFNTIFQGSHKFLSSIEPHVKTGTGIDFKVPVVNTAKIKTLKMTLDEKLGFPDNSFDIVTLLAVLEHLDKPFEICCEIERVLKPGGKLLLTVPSRYARPVLEFLAYKIGIVNSKEIMDHKRYYNKSDLSDLFMKIDGLAFMKHRYFQFGMNNFCILEKK